MTASNRPYIVGLTGGIASGKSAAAAHLKSLGAVVVDADAISHALTLPGGQALPAIREAFGDGVFDAHGALDRSKLGALVFGNLRQRRALEGILHPMIQRQMMQEIDQAGERGDPVVVLNVPLLFECGMDALCDETWVMALEVEQQLERVMARDHLSREAAQERIDSQMPLRDKLQRATVSVRTGRPIEQTRQELSQLWRGLVRNLQS